MNAEPNRIPYMLLADAWPLWGQALKTELRKRIKAFTAARSSFPSEPYRF